MEYLVATIVIMLFCITALAQDRTSESAVIISRDKSKPLKRDKDHTRHMVKPVYLPAFANAPDFTGQLYFNTIAISGSRAVSLLLPARHNILVALGLARQNHRHVPPVSDTLVGKLHYVFDFKFVGWLRYIRQNILFCHEKITT